MNGWLAVNKPTGETSFSVVRFVRKALGVRTVGHTGTLDPLATGVLIVAVGQACKMIVHCNQEDKAYTFRVVWGQARDTEDSDGHVVAESPVRPSREEILAVLPRFVGKILQIPPNYSAVKVRGVRAYTRARKGEEFSLPQREVYIETMRLVESTQDTATFYVRCSCGTYVRSLARDLAHALKTCAFVDFLRRDTVGAVTLNACCELSHIQSSLLPVDAFWPKDRIMYVSDDVLNELSYGRQVRCDASRSGLFFVRGKNSALPASMAYVDGGYINSKRFLCENL